MLSMVFGGYVAGKRRPAPPGADARPPTRPAWVLRCGRAAGGGSHGRWKRPFDFPILLPRNHPQQGS